MTREEHNQLTADLLANLGDQAKVSEILTQLKEDYGQMLAENTLKSEESAKLKTDNESLLKTNMALFLKIGEQKPEEKPADNKKPEVPSFEALFNEKGELI